MKLQIVVDDAAYEVEVEESGEEYSAAPMPLSPRTTIQSSIVAQVAGPVSPAAAALESVDESKVCRSPVAGIVIRVHARAGEKLQMNDLIVVLEAMKMETKIGAPISGTIKSLKVAPGQAVKLRQILAEFE